MTASRPKDNTKTAGNLYDMGCLLLFCLCSMQSAACDYHIIALYKPKRDSSAATRHFFPRKAKSRPPRATTILSPCTSQSVIRQRRLAALSRKVTKHNHTHLPIATFHFARYLRSNIKSSKLILPSALQSAAASLTVILHFARYLRRAIKSSRLILSSLFRSP